ncbi:MAG: cupin domain-containing protein, partial [Deltaproteobacteria bacterium]|nr:cupin domain-containing protein [Deltaproteobacteria bacterium]
MELAKVAAYTGKTPYEIWQEGEGIPVVTGLNVDDVRTVSLKSWERKGARGAFINLMGAGPNCDAYVCEIPPKGQTKPQRHMYEELVYIVKGRGATTVWNEGGPKQTFEWQEGSLFSPPLNSFHQHFNVQGDEP